MNRAKYLFIRVLNRASALRAPKGACRAGFRAGMEGGEGGRRKDEKCKTRAANKMTSHSIFRPAIDRKARPDGASSRDSKELDFGVKKWS